jgi:hypothetical protein
MEAAMTREPKISARGTLWFIAFIVVFGLLTAFDASENHPISRVWPAAFWGLVLAASLVI